MSAGQDGNRREVRRPKTSLTEQRRTGPHQREVRTVVQEERSELLEHLQALLEPAMATLGLVFLVLLLFDFASDDLGDSAQRRVDWAFQAIWAAFLLDFGLRFVVAPEKGAFLRQNWFGALSLAVPFLRPLRALRAARALRSIRLFRLLGGLNRGIRVVRQVTRGRQFAYVAVLTVLVALGGAVGVLYFDRDVPGAQIETLGDAVWWSAAMVTTINNEKYVVSPEARVIAILVRVYAVSVFGYITASIASYLVGKPTPNEAPGGRPVDPRAEIRALREELSALRRDLDVTNGNEVSGAPAGKRTRTRPRRIARGNPR